MRNNNNKKELCEEFLCNVFSLPGILYGLKIAIHRIIKNQLLLKMKLLKNDLLRICRRYGTRPKISVTVDQNVRDSIESGDYKPKKHIGIVRSKVITLPKKIVDGILSSIGETPRRVLIVDGQKMKQYLHSRHLPVEDDEIRRNVEEAAQFIERKYNLNPAATDEERESFRRKHENKIRQRFHFRSYGWKAIDYSEQQSKAYLFGRSPANYAVLHHIFMEMNKRLPSFQPKTLFDFGSGVGCVSWAAKSFWESSLKEYFCVDSSAVMNDLARSILKGGTEAPDTHLKGVFYRQFLPHSDSLKYDIVVSAFSFFELPSLKSRLETLLTLWKKTGQYLIIVEEGTNTGFQVINEARDFILEYSNGSEESKEGAHVLAPCPHDMVCPRFIGDRTPCNFMVSYSNPLSTTPHLIFRETFSYVILRKGPRPVDDRKWPRIVRPVLPRSKHVVCRLCTSEGTLEEVIFTSSKHGKLAYKCARASNWGDFLPFSLDKVVDVSESENSSNPEEKVTKSADES